MSKVYSEQVEKAQMLLKGLKENLSALKGKEIDNQFLEDLEQKSRLAAQSNKENDKLRADLRQKTARANNQLEEVKGLIKKAKQIIKRDFEQSEWQKFGVPDKK